MDAALTPEQTIEVLKRRAILDPSNNGHPFRLVVIEGACANIWARAPHEFTTVTGAADFDRALGDPGNTQHCGLCNDFFGTEAFVRHAPSCVRAYTARLEAQRDREPIWWAKKRFRSLFGSNHGRER